VEFCFGEFLVPQKKVYKLVDKTMKASSVFKKPRLKRVSLVVGEKWRKEVVVEVLEDLVKCRFWKCFVDIF
jgi:hypothetical protein